MKPMRARAPRLSSSGEPLGGGRLRAAALGAASLFLAMGSCTEDRTAAPLAPVFATDVAPILRAKCAVCHSGSAPAGGWSSSPYLGAIGCVESGAAAAIGVGELAPIVRALGNDVHRDMVSAAEKSVLAAWVAGGAPAFVGTVHAPGIVDPRSAAWHGKTLRDVRWAPMLDPQNGEACGRCHDGAPARPPGITLAAPGATSCTTCHTEPGGVLACGTCHGKDARSYPPRDPCFFPADSALAGAHAAHVEPSSLLPAGLACETCHPAPGAEVIGGQHGNGSIEVIFDASKVSGSPSYDPGTGACTVSCHDRGGARSQPAWREPGPMRCGDCHGSPPADHFSGPCNACHREANDQGTQLIAGPLHLNGRVDLGDGSGTCGACHGAGDDPWPSTGAHRAHRDPLLTTSVACADCHLVPALVGDSGHLDGVVQLVFSGRALARSAAPTWDGASCALVACHGANLVDPPAVVPVWRDTTKAASACGACHGIPPSQHTASTSCDRVTCHGSEVTRTIETLAISDEGKVLHVNGSIDSFMMP